MNKCEILQEMWDQPIWAPLSLFGTHRTIWDPWSMGPLGFMWDPLDLFWTPLTILDLRDFFGTP